MTTPVRHDTDADGVAWIVFNDPASRANILDAATLGALDAALGAVASQGARALVVASAKERIFVAGADLRWLASLPDAASAEAFSRNGQLLFQRIGALGIPSVCAIGGACAGGGYELALACNVRLAGDGPATLIGLPETGLGTIPGWGGCTLLPRLIGAEAALGHILEANLVRAADALKLGLVDRVVPDRDLLAAAKAAALELAEKGLPKRPVPAAPPPGFFRDRKAATQGRVRDQMPAPLAAIEVVERCAGLAIGAALEVEARAFGRVTAGPVCKNLVHVHFLREGAKKRTLGGWFQGVAPAPRPVSRVAIAGAGVMGSGIAQFLAARGVDVVLRDVSAELVERGLGVARRIFGDAVRRGGLCEADAEAGFAHITGTTAWRGFEACDMVIEAIVEDVEAKRRLFAELDGIVRPDTILASNSSALPIEETAGHVSNPGRALGIHFFNPVSRMPLVELIIGRDTSAQSADRALGFVKALGKAPVVCRSSPGFLVTRVLFFYLNEAVRLWERGVPTEALDAAMRDFGWPMGPMRLVDEVGVDVTEFIFREMARYYPARFVRTQACARLQAAGLLGRKNGTRAGFYSYEGGRETANDVLTRGIGGLRGSGAGRTDSIAASLMAVMIAEAGRCLEEGVVRSEDDVDFALLAGAGFPAFRGGLMRCSRTIAGPDGPADAGGRGAPAQHATGALSN